MGLTISYPIPNGDEACSLVTNTFCPVESDTNVEFEFIMHVDKIFPKVN